MTTRKQYGYFALERVHGGIATLPDGEKRYFETHDAAFEARREWIEQNSLPEARKEAAEQRRDFVAGCRVEEERTKQPGLLAADLIHKKVVDAEGAYLGDPTGKDFDEIVEEAAKERFPEPTAWGLDSSLDGEVEKIVVWATSLYLDGDPKPLPAFFTWQFGLPIENVLRVLNEIAAEGWYVVQVSEDRGIYAGETNRTAAAVTTARYLLARDV